MNDRFRPSVTVAAIVEQGGRFLIVQEDTPEGLKLNNPAGHLEPCESLVDACVRECLEETARHFTPTAWLGVYHARQQRARGDAIDDFSYVRFAFVGTVSDAVEGQALDDGIVQTLWLTPEELRARAAEHRSPMLMRCIEDHLAGQRLPLAALQTDGSVTRLGRQL